MRPVKDGTTGLELLRLPEGFKYVSFGWTEDPLSDGTPTPGAHDGMAVIEEKDGIITLCRNHELGETNPSLNSQSSQVYDPFAAGGCTNLQFDSKNGTWLKAWKSLSGTFKNCAGGPTPWNSWLSCEESVVENGSSLDNGKKLELTLAHGYIFDVPAVGIAKPVPLKAMGRFVHEDVAVNPETGIVYETEDQTPSGFYWFVPLQPGQLAQGGKLEMLSVRGNPDLIGQADVAANYDVEWVLIDDPERAHSPGTTDGGGVYEQGRRKGGSAFSADGRWLFVNIQTPGITFAIQGPWESVGL